MVAAKALAAQTRGLMKVSVIACNLISTCQVVLACIKVQETQKQMKENRKQYVLNRSTEHEAFKTYYAHVRILSSTNYVSECQAGGQGYYD